MFVQTENTPNPNSLKFLPCKTVSNDGSYEITKKDQINNELVKSIKIKNFYTYGQKENANFIIRNIIDTQDTQVVLKKLLQKNLKKKNQVKF